MIEELSKEDADFARAFGEEVRKQGEGKSSKKLMFDPTTGQFSQVSKLNPFASGEVVTEMTEKGFAR